MVPVRLYAPAQEDVRSALDDPLSHHDALALALPGTGLEVGRQDRRLGFLVLEEQGVVGAVAAQEDDPAARADASHAHDLSGHIHDPVSGEEGFALLGKGLEVELQRAAERLRNGATV